MLSRSENRIFKIGDDEQEGKESTKVGPNLTAQILSMHHSIVGLGLTTLGTLVPFTLRGRLNKTYLTKSVVLAPHWVLSAFVMAVVARLRTVWAPNQRPFVLTAHKAAGLDL